MYRCVWHRYCVEYPIDLVRLKLVVECGIMLEENAKIDLTATVGSVFTVFTGALLI